MQIERRIEAFEKLGSLFKHLGNFPVINQQNEPLFNDFLNYSQKAIHYNGWFTEENILYAFRQWGENLDKKSLENWVEPYGFTSKNSKRIGLITAGNIPLVGFHDFLSVLISGNQILVKQSSQDNQLLPLIKKFLVDYDSRFDPLIQFTDDRLSDFDAVIATGSNNTARYFDYYFGKYPHIIRKNRNSVAVLNGKESAQELQGLGEDIFRYFGLGCRSVSKIFVPTGYDFDLIFKEIVSYHDLLNYKKYENNYNYNKAVYLMSKFKLLENGFLILKEDPSYSSPIGTLFYEFYDDEKTLQDRLVSDADLIQCVVGNQPGFVPFGETQKPSLADYADGVDTLQFLKKLEDN